jgi:hypothetical protein
MPARRSSWNVNQALEESGLMFVSEIPLLTFILLENIE